MLAYLVRFSIRFYGIVIALALLILFYGSYRFTNAGLDIFPEFAPKQIIIQTESPGYSAEQVEILVTQRIETAISGLMGLQFTRAPNQYKGCRSSPPFLLKTVIFTVTAS